MSGAKADVRSALIHIHNGYPTNSTHRKMYRNAKTMDFEKQFICSDDINSWVTITIEAK